MRVERMGLQPQTCVTAQDADMLGHVEEDTWNVWRRLPKLEPRRYGSCLWSRSSGNVPANITMAIVSRSRTISS
jgi:hypothetical protein